MRNRARPPKLQTVAQGIDINLAGYSPDKAVLPTLPKLQVLADTIKNRRESSNSRSDAISARVASLNS